MRELFDTIYNTQNMNESPTSFTRHWSDISFCNFLADYDRRNDMGKYCRRLNDKKGGLYFLGKINKSAILEFIF